MAADKRITAATEKKFEEKGQKPPPNPVPPKVAPGAGSTSKTEKAEK
jgi:hypothetical protein